MQAQKLANENELVQSTCGRKCYQCYWKKIEVDALEYKNSEWDAKIILIC